MAKIEWKPGNMVYPLPAVMVSCADAKGNSNIITVAWTGTVCTNPPMAYISVRPERHSYQMIRESGEFVINLTTKELAKVTDFCGVRSGRDIDKFSEMKLTKEKASVVSAPMIGESPVNIECRVTQVLELGSHHMFLAEVAAVHVDDVYMDEKQKFDLAKAEPLAYSHGEYYSLGELLGTFGYSVKKKKSYETIKNKKAKLNFWKAAFASCFCMMLVTPFIGEQFGLPSSFSDVYLDDVHIGAVRDPANVESLLLEARLQLAKEQKKMVLADAQCRYEPVKTIFSKSITEDELYERLYEYLKNDTVDIQRAYMMKIGTYTVYLDNIEDIYEVLEIAKAQYDPENRFQVNIVADFEREINMYTAELISADTQVQEIETVGVKVSEIPIFDVQENVPEENTDIPEQEEPSVPEQPAEEPQGAAGPGEDGMKEMYFGEKVEIAEAYVSKSLITSPEEAAEQITKENQKKGIYEVQSGDTLSTIANSHGLYVKEMLALNEGLDENTMLHIGDEIVITVPTPELTVMSVEQTTYEEAYYAEIQYEYEDSWYTTRSEVLQEEQPGYHEVSALVTKRNGSEVSREVVNETVLQEPVSKIIKIGTQTPPTFIKPISGGRRTSSFGRRKAPKRGASTNHKGIDLATPTGTAVMASSSGKVTRAGWLGSYGYVIYISHPDGKETRYAHLSKILVSAGQTVKQGQKIALSGNTGRSTGPHLHFELRVNGTPVNPYNYI